MVSNMFTEASKSETSVSKRLMETSNSSNLLSTFMEDVPIVKSPVMFAEPLTSSVLDGEEVPIPTFPES